MLLAYVGADVLILIFIIRILAGNARCAHKTSHFLLILFRSQSIRDFNVNICYFADH